LKKPLLILLAALALGLRYWQADQALRHETSAFPQGQKGFFKAWVSEEPQVLFEHLPGSHDTGRLNGFYQPFVKEVRAVCTLISFDGKPLPPIKVRCTFRLSAKVPQEVLSYGELVDIAGKIQPPSSAVNPGQFDYAHYLKTKGVAYVLYAGPGEWGKSPTISPENPSPLGLGFGGPQGISPVGAVGEMGRVRGDGTPSFSTLTPTLSRLGRGGREYGWFFLRWAYGLRRWAEEAIYRYLPFPENALLDGILLGERTPLPDDMVQSFFLTGTIHILAVSGMITAFLAGLFFIVFRAFQFKRKWAAGLTLVALIFFIFMTGAHPPVCRAGLFSALALLAVLLERRIHGGALLLTTATLLVAWNPFVVEDLSFQISFLATAGLMVMASWMMKKLSFLWRPAAMLVTATTAAQLAVWCLIVFDFNQLSVYSILSNLLIVPLALFATAGGMTLLTGAFLHPALGNLFGAACEAPLRLLIVLADALSKLPKAEWIVASPPLAWVLVFHALLLATFFFYWPTPQPEKPSDQWKKRREGIFKGRRWMIRAWCLFLAAAVLALAVSAFQPRPFRIVYLAVGHGNAAVLESPQGKVFVLDGGKNSHGPDRYNLVVAYLRHIGIQKVEGVLNTHPDQDHVGGLVNLLSACPVADAYEGCRASSKSEIYREFKETLQRRMVRLIPLKEGDRIQDLGPIQISVIHPPDGFAPRKNADNNLSLVTLVSYAGCNLVFPGDLEKDGILKLLKDNRPFPRVDWLMAPHHGRASGEPLLCARGLKPRFVVLSDWRDYPEDHDDFRSAVPEAVVLSTAQEGAIEMEIYSDGHGRYRTFRHSEWKYFSRQSTVGSPQ
jgi:competence protein ComEC